MFNRLLQTATTAFSRIKKNKKKKQTTLLRCVSHREGSQATFPYAPWQPFREETEKKGGKEDVRRSEGQRRSNRNEKTDWATPAS